MPPLDHLHCRSPYRTRGAVLTKRSFAQAILTKYTTNQRLSILGLDDGDGKPKVVQQQSTLSDKVRALTPFAANPLPSGRTLHLRLMRVP